LDWQIRRYLFWRAVRRALYSIVALAAAVALYWFAIKYGVQ
jgi:hypothetical protein